MVINHDMIFGNGDEEDSEEIEEATIIYTSFGKVDKTTVLAAVEFYERNRIRKTRYRRSDKGKDAKRRELDDRLLSRQLIKLVKNGKCICGKIQDDCTEHVNLVNRYKNIIEKYVGLK